MPVTAPEIEQTGQAQDALAPLYHVVLLDDDDHTYEYVIRMLGTLFGFDADKAMGHAREVDQTGRTVLITTTRERAELKQEQIHGFGSDPLLPRSKGSMSAVLEPA
jgi:ATP-dependent Clp protease adaptor protein ClpS